MILEPDLLREFSSSRPVDNIAKFGIVPKLIGQYTSHGGSRASDCTASIWNTPSA